MLCQGAVTNTFLPLSGRHYSYTCIVPDSPQLLKTYYDHIIPYRHHLKKSPTTPSNPPLAETHLKFPPFSYKRPLPYHRKRVPAWDTNIPIPDKPTPMQSNLAPHKKTNSTHGMCTSSVPPYHPISLTSTDVYSRIGTLKYCGLESLGAQMMNTRCVINTFRSRELITSFRQCCLDDDLAKGKEPKNKKNKKRETGARV